MVSAGLKIDRFSDKHLAKAFCLDLFPFNFTKPNQQDLADLVNIDKTLRKH
ncbi:hypothetical protein FHR24_003129 [Wenyingzhuangia heitensis]|uniref:Transposase n=1 Tax=Wenyingzhuangia heitensis TaxID=1487859 RepID=A0ABX0UCR4_9FLAO|nr:hypothetical protein [Wenyingzhuangia heitensis]